MGFPGTWMTESESMAYRVVPKCACSTIGQIMFYSDHGRFFDGDIHDSTEGLHKWSQEYSQGPITERAQAQDTYTFTCVRNPYTRILSSFFDKICGIQRNGKRYRGNLVPNIIRKYGVEVEGRFRPDPILSPLPAFRPRHHQMAPPDGPGHSLVRHVRACFHAHCERWANMTNSSPPKISKPA